MKDIAKSRPVVTKSKTRRQFLAASGVATAAKTVGATAPEESPIFSFGLMADCQYANAETKGTRYYRESPRKLKAAVDELNRRNPVFSFHLGDFIDRDFTSFDDLLPITGKLRSKLYHALGNHDFDVKDEEKDKVPGVLGLEKGYYSFRKNQFRFVVLDTTEVSPYRNRRGTEEHRMATAELQSLVKEGFPGAKPWNGRPGRKQITWLESELEKATSEGESVIVLGHHPILPMEGHAIWSARTVSRLLEKYPCVKVYINGHNHAGYYVDSKGMHYLTLDGMVETRESNAFALVGVFLDRLEIAGYERQESYVLKFR